MSTHPHPRRTRLHLVDPAPARERPRDGAERGDVPGWVLITLMTAGLVTALWVVAKGQLVEHVPERAVLGEGLSRADAAARGTSGAPPSPTSRWCRCSSSCCSSRCSSSAWRCTPATRSSPARPRVPGSGARADAVAGQGVSRTQALISRSLSPRLRAPRHRPRGGGRGVRVVEVRVVAPVPVLGLLGPDDRLDVVGRAFLESQ